METLGIVKTDAIFSIESSDKINCVVDVPISIPTLNKVSVILSTPFEYVSLSAG
jgi:hypothetical protein